MNDQYEKNITSGTPTPEIPPHGWDGRIPPDEWRDIYALEEILIRVRKEANL